MARRGGGGGTTQGVDPRLIEAALAAQEAGTAFTRAQTAAIADELGIKRESLGLERELGQGKLQLGARELSDKDRQARLAAALEALSQGSKERIASQGERSAIQSDLIKRPDITVDTLARALAEGGDTSLFNAIATKNAKAREAAVRAAAMSPEMLKASSDAQREKNLKPALEAQFPGGYAQALALAFPKPGNEVKFEPEKFAGVSTPATEDRYTQLANSLLGSAGVSGNQPAGTNRGAPLIQHGTIVGGPPGYDLNVNTGEWIPSNTVGTINGRPAPDVIAEGALKSGVSPEDTRSREVFNKLMQGEKSTVPTITNQATPVSNLLTTANGTPQMDIPLVKPPEVVAPPPMETPATTGRPDLYSHALASLFSPLLTKGAPPWVDPADIERQRKLREAMAMQQNQ